MQKKKGPNKQGLARADGKLGGRETMYWVVVLTMEM
jgi:hypothetical protein